MENEKQNMEKNKTKQNKKQFENDFHYTKKQQQKIGSKIQNFVISFRFHFIDNCEISTEEIEMHEFAEEKKKKQQELHSMKTKNDVVVDVDRYY